MFEVGFSELLLIMALALIVLGPEKLPKVASQVGRWMGRARAMARQFRETLEEEVQLEPTVRRPGANAAGSGNPASAAAAAGGYAAAATAGESAPATATHGTSVDGGYSTVGDDADTRHSDYPGAAYEPPEPSSDPLTPAPSSPYDEPATVHGDSAANAGFDANLDPTAPLADPHGQRGA